MSNESIHRMIRWLAPQYIAWDGIRATNGRPRRPMLSTQHQEHPSSNVKLFVRDTMYIYHISYEVRDENTTYGG